MGIFKAYDIRGKYPSEINESIAYKTGRALVSFFGVKKIVVGQDARLSSPVLVKALTQGIIDQGADVIKIGLCSTPMFYFASNLAEAAVMITASHNPKEYNGFKLCRKGAFSISWETGIKEIEKLVQNERFKKICYSRKGRVIQKNVLPAYIKYNLNFLSKKKGRKLKLVLDAGNGMCGYTFPKIFAHIKDTELIELYTKVDFLFPHHVPNPLKYSTLKDLRKKVVKEGADFGVATDGDGDRCILIDERGRIISADLLTALIAKWLLRKRKKGKLQIRKNKIMYDVRCSKIVPEVIKENGGQAIISRVGHSFIKKKMRELGVLFAGELSGHLYYQANNYAESSFITTALAMNMLKESGMRLSELVLPLRKYFASGEINFRVKDKEKKIEEVERKLKKRYKTKIVKVLHLDGLSMYFQDWWFNLRESHTEDLLRLNLEADSKLMLEKRMKEVGKMIK